VVTAVVVVLTRSVDVVGETKVDVVMVVLSAEEKIEVEIAVEVENADLKLMETNVVDAAVFKVDTVVYVVAEHESAAIDSTAE